MFFQSIDPPSLFANYADYGFVSLILFAKLFRTAKLNTALKVSVYIIGLFKGEARATPFSYTENKGPG